MLRNDFEPDLEFNSDSRSESDPDEYDHCDSDPDESDPDSSEW